MGLLDRRRDVADYVAEGAQPSEHHGRELPDRRIEQARRQDEHAHALPPPTGPEAPPPVVTLTRPVGNFGYEPVTFLVGVGDPVEVLGRDHLRDTVDVTNQSGFLLGTPCTVFLFKRKEDADTFAHQIANGGLAQALASRPRCVVIPDAAGRQLQHTASVWALAVDIAGNGAVQACVDISAERRHVPQGGRD